MPEKRMGEQWTLIQLGGTLSLRKLRAGEKLLCQHEAFFS